MIKLMSVWILLCVGVSDASSDVNIRGNIVYILLLTIIVRAHSIFCGFNHESTCLYSPASRVHVDLN